MRDFGEVEKPPLGDLAHHGVKGMHWGVRKNTPTNAGYGSSQRQYDKKQFGKGGVKRINRRLNAGADLKTARKKESSFRAKKGIAVGLALTFAPQIAEGLSVVGNMGKNVFDVASQNVASRAETNRGRAAAANAMGLPRHSTNGPTFAKNKNGVFNITSA